MNYSEWKKSTDEEKQAYEKIWMDTYINAVFVGTFERAEKELLKIREWKNRDVK